MNLTQIKYMVDVVIKLHGKAGACKGMKRQAYCGYGQHSGDKNANSNNANITVNLY